MISELKNVCVSFGANEILKDINLKIEDKDRIGLIGANGAGKSTLLNVITKNIDITSGELINAQKRIGYLKQNTDLVSDFTVKQIFESVFSELLEVEKELKKLYSEISLYEEGSSEYKALFSKYANLQTRFEQQDGYNIQVKINTVKTGMGFSDIDDERLVSSLSGGEKTRLSLASLLLSEPDLLILDEPTNHLDFKTLSWLEVYLSSYKGAVLMVSHDRYFLDKCVNEIAEIYKGNLCRYKGNYSKYVVLKAEKFANMEKEYEKQQNEIASLKEYIAKNKVRASTAKSAKSRENILEKMEILEKPSDYLKSIKLKFDYKNEPVKDVLDVKNLCVKIGDRVLKYNVNLHVLRGEKIAVVGENGIGKSTLLKALLGLSKDSTGEINWGGNVKKAYFEQESTLLHDEKTVLSEIHDKYPSMYEGEIRSLLGKVLITGEDIYKNVGVLSGGEKAKLKFTLMNLEKGNVLILDEPTNHLDLRAKEVLDKTLYDYTGTIIMVSHDRYLLNKVPTKIIEITKDDIISYDGNYDYYSEKKKDFQPQKANEQKENKEKKANENTYFRSKEDRKKEVKRKNDIKALEKKIEEVEELTEILQSEIADPALASDFEALSEKCNKLEEIKNELNSLYEKWEELMSDE